MEKLLKAAEKHAALMLEAEKRIWENPETGFKEFKTHAYLKENFVALGYDVKEADGITGFYTTVDTGRKGPTVLVLGELDSVICPSHPESDPVTGAVHACGHNCQCAALLGIAAALKEDGVLDALSGKIKLCAVPAEELLEITYRSELIKKGVIRYYGGKTEFMSRGYFDDCDLAIMVHTGGGLHLNRGSVGCITKRVIYKGTAAHAGAAPWDGHNALYAATSGINSANALRETFRESDVIRFHPIITEGGQMVNSIPEQVCIESYVRGKTYDAIVKANKRINQALIGSALSLGCNVEIIDAPGYAPELHDEQLMDVTCEAATLALGSACTRSSFISTGSTDMGDLSGVMPTVQPSCGGATGKGHGNDYKIADPMKATVYSAKWQLGILYLLLKDDAKRALEIKQNFKPTYPSIQDYLDYVQKVFSNGDRILYNPDSTATIQL